MRKSNYLKKIKIQNYRSCANTSLNLDSDLTTLIGLNGTGKSNILGALRLLKDLRGNRYMRSRPDDLQLSKSKVELDFVLGGKEYEIVADLRYEVDEQNNDDVYASYVKYRKKDSKEWSEIDPNTYDLVQHFRTSSHRKLSDYSSMFEKKTIPEIKVEMKIIEYFASISYYGATQFSDPSKCPVSIELEDSRRLSRSSYRTSRTHEKFIYDLYLAWNDKQKNPAFNRFIDTVNSNGIGLIQNIDFLTQKLPSSTYEIKSGGRISKTEKKRDIVIPLVHIDGLSLSPNALSEGTFKTLALVFYILEDKSDLLLIEEPEVCVHHGLLNSIVELIKIRSDKKQVVISTHSDFVLDQLSPEGVVLVSKEKGVGTRARSLTKTLSKNDYQVLKSYLLESGNLGEYWRAGGFENGKN